MENRSSKKQKKRKSNKKRIIIGTLSVILIAILSFAGYYAYHIFKFTKEIQVKAPAKTKMVATKKWTGGRVNILLVGGDARSKDKVDNSDSMILLSADPKTHQAQMYSIMRDTFWKIPGHSYQKINASNLIGGPELAVQTVENFLDIPINFYVETDFQGFKKMVDILGGVDINVEEDMNYDDPTDGTSIHLKKGMQHLTGKTALDFARFRHDAMGDFNRTKRQRELLKIIAEKTASTYGLLKVPQLLDALAPYVQTNMTTSEMVEIANLLHGVNVSELQTEQVPQMNDILQKSIPKYGSVLIPNVLATRQYIHQQLGMTDTPTATAQEQYYWDLYKNGGSVDSTNKKTSGTTSSTVSTYHTATSKSTSSTVQATHPATQNTKSYSSTTRTTQSTTTGTTPTPSTETTQSTTTKTAPTPSNGTTQSTTTGTTPTPSTETTPTPSTETTPTPSNGTTTGSASGSNP